MEAYNLNRFENQSINHFPIISDRGDNNDLKHRLIALEVRANNISVKMNDLRLDNRFLNIDIIEIQYLVELCSEKIDEIQSSQQEDQDLMSIDIEYYMFELSQKIKDIEEFLIYEKELKLQ